MKTISYKFVFSKTYDSLKAEGTNIYVKQEAAGKWSAIRGPWNWTGRRHYSSTPSGAVNKLLRREEKEGWK